MSPLISERTTQQYRCRRVQLRVVVLDNNFARVYNQTTVGGPQSNAYYRENSRLVMPVIEGSVSGVVTVRYTSTV